MTIQEFYESVHGDYKNVLTRLPSDALVLRFLKRFPADPSYLELTEAVEKGDVAASFEASHKLKGLAGNLGLFELFDLLTMLTEQLRPKTAPADPELFARVKQSYEAVISEIEKLE